MIRHSSMLLPAGLLATACALVGCRRSDSTSSHASASQSPAQSPGAAAPASAATVVSEPQSGRASNADSDTGSVHPSGAVPLPPSPGVPLVRGLTLVSALHFPDGDRENTVLVDDVTPEGVSYTWHYLQEASGHKPVVGEYTRFVRANDLASAPRINTVYFGRGRDESPGYTAMSVSRATFNQVRTEGKTPYTITELTAGPGAVGALLPTRLAYRGTLALASTTYDPMPILLNGRRTTLPAMHLHGHFAFQETTLRADYWVLADSAHPLLLKAVTGPDVFQMVRIDLPEDAATRVASVEHDLEQSCRAELPGIYFAFASPDLEPPSEPAVDAVATLLAHHPDWSLAIEGHTDSIGDPMANQRLSVQRAGAVRMALVERRIAPGRLQSAGFGATRPRESNATVEGRARNRRVELVRNCPAGA